MAETRIVRSRGSGRTVLAKDHYASDDDRHNVHPRPHQRFNRTTATHDNTTTREVKRNSESSSAHRTTRKESNNSTFEEFDGIADILAVSHVSDKPIGKKRPPVSLPPPLLRAKTLPAIISPTLGILQAQLEARQKEVAVTTEIQEENEEEEDEDDSDTSRKEDSTPSTRRVSSDSRVEPSRVEPPAVVAPVPQPVQATAPPKIEELVEPKRCEDTPSESESGGGGGSKWRRRRRRRGSDNKGSTPTTPNSTWHNDAGSSSPRSSVSGASVPPIASSKSPSVSPRHSVSSTCSSTSSYLGLNPPQLIAPNPTPVKSKNSEGGSGSRASLAKLARLLMSRDKASSKASTSSESKTNSVTTFNASVATWQAAAHTILMKRSASIDSLIENNSVTGHGQAQGDQEGVGCDSPSTRRVSPSSSSSSPLGGSGGRPTPPPAPPPHALPVLPVVRVDAAPTLENTLGGSDPFLPGTSNAAGQSGRRGALTTSPSVPNRLARGSNAQAPVGGLGLKASEKSTNSLELVLDTMIPLSKSEKKKLEKWSKFNIDLQALFVSVEQELVERTQHILVTTDVDVNNVNGDGFAPLDVAVMTSNVAIVRLLQAYGAKETYRFPTKESRANQLNNLVKEAERCVEDLSACVQNASANGTLSAALLKEKEKKLAVWERREHLLKRMKQGFDNIQPPDPPKLIQAEVVGNQSIRVIFHDSETASFPYTVVTKYKVQWACNIEFSPLIGSREVVDLQRSEVTLSNLKQGNCYFVRVAAGNMKGYSDFQYSTPPSSTPSSWRDVEHQSSRISGRLRKLDDLFHQIANSRPDSSSVSKVSLDLAETPQQQRRQVRKSIKNLFTSAPKFQKSMKRGVYLSCLLYNEDRVLVTTEETLPVIEVDETYPSSLHMDFHWLMKVACTWEDVKALRQDMERSHSASNVHFRSKLLQAVEQMQNALGIQDIGHLFYKPLKDNEGTIVLCTVRHVSDPKSISSLSIRWLPLTKIQKKLILSGENTESTTEPMASEMLLSSLQEMITYNQVSYISLPRGLYIGYVKLRSSVDLIRVMVPLKTPNVPPHCRVRENPHVSCEEWAWLKKLGVNKEEKEKGGEDEEGKVTEEDEVTEKRTDVQLRFQRLIGAAARTLLTHLDVPTDLYDSHRIYDMEVVELSPDVSFVLLLPPIENVCAVPGQNDELSLRQDFIALPVQIFEMIHMCTYQPNFIARYSRLSSILEMDNMVATHAHREAFSAVEVTAAKVRLSQLQQFQAQVDDTWRGMRWIMDVMTFARDKQATGWIPMQKVFDLGDRISDNKRNSEDGGSPSRLSPLLVVPPEGECTLQVPVQPQRRLSREEIDQSFLFIAQLQMPGDTNKGGGSPMEIRRCASTSRLMTVGLSDNEDDCLVSVKRIENDDVGVASSSSERADDDDDDEDLDEGLVHRPKIIVGCPDDTDDSLTMTVSPLCSDNPNDNDDEDDLESAEIRNRMYRARTEDTLTIGNTIQIRRPSLVRVSSLGEATSHCGSMAGDIITYGLGVEGSALFPARDDESPFFSDELSDYALPVDDDGIEAEKEDEPEEEDFSKHSKKPSSHHVRSSRSKTPDRPSYSPDVIRVYAGYSSGLPKGTSVRLQVSSQTTVREVVDLVVKQLNMAIILKGKGGPIYGNNELRDFVLAARVATREHVLEDESYVLEIQEPWSKGRLIIRRLTESE